MYSEFGVKDLYEVSLKTTDSMTINNQNFEADEVFMFFKKLEISNISGENENRQANGGKNNFNLVLWDSVKSVDFIFEAGLLNMSGLNILSQSRVVDTGSTNVDLPIREELITSSSGIATTKYSATTSRPIFVYKTSGSIILEKLAIVGVSGTSVNLGIGNATTSIIIDYYFRDDNVRYYEIGGENIKGFFKMTSKINVVDAKDGIRTTMLFVMPKVKIMSNINLTFGVKANPIVSVFKVRAVPDSEGKALARFIYLNQDIEG